MTHDDKRPPQRAANERDGKRPYVSPKLIEYGSVAKLTQAGGSVQLDATSTYMMVSCL